VLRRLLDRPALFTTDVARQWWELPARDNLARELDSLA
jgi:predicted metal-dependent HD superfamily phosphohydrolase